MLFTAPFLCANSAVIKEQEVSLSNYVSSNFDHQVITKKDQTFYDQAKPRALVKQKHVLAVFVHGTLFPFPSIKTINAWANDQFQENAPKSSYLELLRDKSLFRNQPIGPFGFNPIISACSSVASGAELISWFFQEMYKLLPKDDYAVVHSYTFGWDGSLSLTRRKEQAKELLKALEGEVTRLKSQFPGQDFEVIVTGHSHGGNVALHTADWYDKNSECLIDHLILFGTPVHGDTQDLITSPLFKNVYNFHSNGDFIQIADVVSTKHYVPSRIFSHAMPLNNLSIKQVLVEIGNYQPNHAELWFFRRPIVFFFRSWLPTAPLPLAAFTPLLLYELKKINQTEQFFKLVLSPNQSQVSVKFIPFLHYRDMQDYDKTGINLRFYESHFDFSHILKQLPRIQNE